MLGTDEDEYTDMLRWILSSSGSSKIINWEWLTAVGCTNPMDCRGSRLLPTETFPFMQHCPMARIL